jgi:Ni/Co efflux regulator RcnB
MNRITKNLISTAAAGLLVAGPVAFTPAFADQITLGVQQNQDRDRDWEQNREREQNREWEQNRDWNAQCRDNRDFRVRGDDRCDERKQWRDTRNNARWDGDHHNGYYGANGWSFGPPPQNAYGRRNFALGYHPWAAGDRLGYYNGRYTEVNYRNQNLKKPKRGDHWVRDDRGVFILASISTGQIRQVLNRNAH